MQNIPTRLNNPGDLKDPKTGTFRRFNNPQEGFTALKNDLSIKMTGKSKTGVTPKSDLLHFSSVYAPASDRNDPVSYANNLAKKLGVPVNTPISQLSNRLDDFASAIADNEGYQGQRILGTTVMAPQYQSPTSKDPETFKQKIIQKYPNGVSSDGTPYSQMDARDLTERIVNKYPDGVTSDGIRYSDFLKGDGSNAPTSNLGRGYVQAPEYEEDVSVPYDVSHPASGLLSEVNKGLGGIPGAVGGFLGNVAKSATKPVASMFAYPIQAAEQIIGGETDEKKLADVPLLSSIYGDFPVPKDAKDVKKAVGQGLETVALGLAPVAGGAIYGTGNSLEQGNDLFSGKTALKAGLGALTGKLSKEAAPYISKGVSAVTPKFIKNAVSSVTTPVAEKVGHFMDSTKILPDALSKPINTAANAVNNAPGALWGAIKSQYGGSASGLSEKALKAQVEEQVQKALGVNGKKSAGVAVNTGKKMRQGIETLYDDAPNIKVKDPVTDDLIDYDPTTASVHQNVEALAKSKQNIYDDLAKNVEIAHKGGVIVDKTDTLQYLDDVANSTRPAAARNAALKLSAEIKRLNSPLEIQAYLQDLNKGLSGQAMGTSQNIAKGIEADATKKLTDALDKSVLSIDDALPGAEKLIKGFEKGGNTYQTMQTYDKYIQSGGYNAADVYDDVANKIYKPEVAKQVISDAKNFFREQGFPQLGDDFEKSVSTQGLTPDKVIESAKNIIGSGSGQTTMPIRILKDKYSNLKSIENGLVNKAQQLARRPDGGLGGGLYDYINAFNLADAFDIIINPANAVKAGIRYGLLSKLGVNKNPETMLQKVFDTVGTYKNLQKGIVPQAEGALSNLMKNIGSGGIQKTISPTK